MDGNNRTYLPKSVREEVGAHPEDIIWLGADNDGWVGLMRAELIEAGDQSPEVMEAYARVAVRQMPDENRVSLLAESAELIQKDKGQHTDEVKSRERLLCAYMVGRDGMVKLRMSFDEEQLEAFMVQEIPPKLIVFLDSHTTPVFIMRGGNVQFCAEDDLGEKLDCLLKRQGYGKKRGDNGYYG